MYEKLFILLCVVNVIKATLPSTITDSPFCVICDCNTTSATVTCDGITFKRDLFTTTSYWMNHDANETYPYAQIEIHNTELSHVSQFANLTQLKTLDLSRNKIQIIDKGSFHLLQNMSVLDLSENGLVSENFDPDIFQGVYQEGAYLPLRSLTTLRLGNNELHTLHQDVFEHLMNLKTLDLRGNPLRIIDQQTTIAISGLIYLEDLDLSYTGLTRVPKDMFHTPKRLRCLDLSGNALTRVPKALEFTHNLEVLVLDANPIGNITELEGFPKLEHLQILNMSYCPNISRIEDKSMCGLTNLKQLHITNNERLSYIGKNALSHYENGSETETWPNLEKLHLQRNKLTHLDSHLLGRWDIIEVIDITDNQWACECENQWLLDTLYKYIEQAQNTRLEGLWCASPIEMKDQLFMNIHNNHSIMRCLDLNGARPERDATFLIVALVGLLIAIPLVLGLMLCHRRNWFGYFESGPAAFSRQFYNRATPDDDFDS